MKSGKLNFLELPGPLQACNGTAFPLPFDLESISHNYIMIVFKLHFSLCICFALGIVTLRVTVGLH
jgi:hypothetical protein